jgi:hypothetical protein
MPKEGMRQIATKNKEVSPGAVNEPPPPTLTLRGGGFLPAELRRFHVWRVCLPYSIE